jgi:hypothetical protein
VTNYNVDHEGINGWRVWWVGADGLIREQSFRSLVAASQWIDFMESLSD